MNEKSCNTCARHVQAGRLEDAPAECWTCGGGTNLPNWTPIVMHPGGRITVAPGVDVSLGGGTITVPPAPPSPLREGSVAKPANPLAVQHGGSHYKDMPIQPVEFCHANGIGFIEGGVIKYVCRWRKKNGIEDLKKARHFLDVLIELETSKLQRTPK
jgi:hypothetical protein